MAIIYTNQNADNNSPNAFGDVSRVYQEAKNLGIELNPFDIEGFLSQNGFTLIREDMAGEVSGYIEKRQSGWTIGVNLYQSSRRQRFTMAHEYAHYVLHKTLLEKKGRWEDELLMRSDERNEVEKQANQFASELLIPKEDFVKAISEGITEIDKLADIFNVSIAATRYRAFKLGYLDRY